MEIHSLTSANTRPRRPAFTLIELLVVVAVIALLIALLLPGLSRAKERGRMAKCLGNLRAAAVAFNMYSADYDGYLAPDFSYALDNNGVFWAQEWDLGYNRSLGQWLPNRGILSPYFPCNTLPNCPDIPPEMIGSQALTSYNIQNNPANIYQMSSAINYYGEARSKFVQISCPAKTAIFGECGAISNSGPFSLLTAPAFKPPSSAFSSGSVLGSSNFDPNLMCLHLKQGGVAWADGHATMESPWFANSTSLASAARAAIQQRYNFGWFMPTPANINPSTATSAQIKAYPQADDYFTLSR